jgi:hypothetical protein
VSLTDSGVGGRRTAITNPFGFYRFDNVSSGSTYTIAVISRLYTFTPQTVQVNDNLANVDFVAQ